MTNPSADDRRSTVVTDPSDSDHQSVDGDDEDEYEEIEEEVEVEEEIEVDDDDEDSDLGEDLTPDHQDDVAPDIETIGHEEQSHSGSITQENAMMLPSTNIYALGGSRSPLISDQMDASVGRESNVNHVNLQYPELGKDAIATGGHEPKESSSLSRIRTTKYNDDSHYKNKASLSDNGPVNVQSTEAVISSGVELASAVSVQRNLDGKAAPQYSEEEKKHVQTEDIKLSEPRFSRLDFPMAKRRSLSPDVEFKDGTNRPAVICDFFAKGWCIKGKSCRFLHVRDITAEQLVKAETDANQSTAPRTSEGFELFNKKPRLTSFSDEEASALDTLYSSKRVLSPKLGQSLKWNSEYNDNYGISGRDYLRHNWYLNDYAKHGSEEMAAKRSQFSCDEPIPLLRQSYETSSRTGTLPPTYISSLTRSSLSNLDPLVTQKSLDGERGYGASISASLRKTSSPFSVSESGNPSRKPVSGDYWRSDRYKTETSSYNWEPSPPFRPSFPLTQSLLSSINQYDPIRDSVEPSRSGEVSSRFSGASRGTFVSEYDFHKQSLSGHYNVHDNILNKKFFGKEFPSAEPGTPVTAMSELQSKVAIPEQEKLLDSAHLQDITKSNISNAGNGFATQTIRLRETSKSKVDMSEQISEMEAAVKVGEDIVKETKAMKHFRAALIDFVKELVKPTWREGNLSKDAHKMIVKRAVDRIISTIPAHQVPCTPESVELYLSSSQPKIAKLVEGYIDKYGKL